MGLDLEIDEQWIAHETAARAVERVLARGEDGHALEEAINDALYHERQRLARAGTDRRALRDRAFWAKVARELPMAGDPRRRALLRQIVERHMDEIAGHFDPRVYTVATRALPVGLTVLLNGLSPGRLLRRLPELRTLGRNLVFEGELDGLRTLVERGTVILVPTHSSNLDAPLLGYAIYRMGLPPFAYGAGLNLFVNPLASFFMHNLGSYTVDRQKSDPLYGEVLKDYVTVLLESGRHNVFFPGGTRSRSGAVERHLKKGLLGTALVAFHGNLKAQRKRPRIYIVPCTCTYPLVLEASALIEQYLERSGRERFIVVQERYGTVRKWAGFLQRLFELDVRVHVVVGRALDPFGNEVDEHGDSLDPRGRAVDPAGYLRREGELVLDAARDAEYTRVLAAKVAATWKRDTVAQPTHVAAFATFELLWRDARQADLYRFLRELGSDSQLPRDRVQAEMGRLLDELRERENRGEIRLLPQMREGGAEGVLAAALKTFGGYHRGRVLTARGARLRVGDPRLLFFYRNRLDGYGLLGTPSLLKEAPSP